MAHSITLNPPWHTCKLAPRKSSGGVFQKAHPRLNLYLHNGPRVAEWLEGHPRATPCSRSRPYCLLLNFLLNDHKATWLKRDHTSGSPVSSLRNHELDLPSLAAYPEKHKELSLPFLSGTKTRRNTGWLMAQDTQEIPPASRGWFIAWNTQDTPCTSVKIIVWLI